jgi:hypothetical protein
MDNNTATKTLPNSVTEIKNVYTKFYEMINEYNNIGPQCKKEYLSLVTGWLVREKDSIAFKETQEKK